jgi:Ca2+-binding RTX toxin-like protein
MSRVLRRAFASICVMSLLATTLVVQAAAQEPPRPPGQDFVITPADLKFVLDQIQIGEDHARRVVTTDPEASPLCSSRAAFRDGVFEQFWEEPNGDRCVGSALLPHGLRTVDGRWNNLQPGQTTYGASDQVFPRMLEPEFKAAEPAPPGAPTVPGQPTAPTTYEQTSGFVYDSQPRTVSNLIVDQTTNNPAAVAKLVEFVNEGLDAHLVDPSGNRVDIAPGTTAETVMATYPDHGIFIQNVATDEGLSAPFSSWMTLFGQFFDHGLDLVEKGGNGTVVVPLTMDDPLRSHPDFDPRMPYLMLSRATLADGSRDSENRTTPYVDQNQTYTSHPAHQAFLREYVEGPDGRTAITGHLLDSPVAGGIPTWADIKAQALARLGFQLEDADVLDVPLMVTDPYGRFVADEATGFPLFVAAGGNGTVSGTPDAPLTRGDVEGAGHAFLDDIAHDAVPVATNGDLLTRGQRDPEGALPEGAYDGDLLDDHYVTGDGRGNENIGLTAVHHIFHSEHNRLIGQIEEVIAFDAAQPNGGFDLDAGFAEDGYWDQGERIFQAARFFNEMQYQHLAVEEFLRTVVPTMDVQPLNESAYHSELDGAITAEFAHVVYRFGHSMLTETLPRIYDDGTVEDLSLLEGFVNPNQFTKNGTISPDEAAASLIRGLAGQVGNGIDEFVTDTLRNNLLGLPLDLATINMTRARETGIPSLQAARSQFYAATLDPTLVPYSSWEDFRLGLKHADSILNFVAAYGKGDAELETAPTMEAKRARAAVLITDPAYMAMDPALSGLNDVDFWMGGLAERTNVFGGMLGSTFNHVFETQAELAQNADRFYYLTRTQGQNFLSQLEGNSFTELIQRNTTVEGVPHDIFSFPGQVFYMDLLMTVDPATWPTGLTLLNGNVRYTGEDHVVMYGRNVDDVMRGGIGDDTLWGRDGRDVLEGDDGADSLMGGDGDDILTDLFGDDTLTGGAGNDAIRSGPGADLVLAGSGDDYVSLTRDDASDAFNGVGDDWILGGTGSDRVWGGEGDDWMEGGQGHDLLQGDNAIVFQNDPNGGHDVIIGGPGNNDHDSDGGDDVMVGGPGMDRNEGMLGFDWVTYKGHQTPVVADMRFTGLMPADVAGFRDRFDLVEGLSGWNGDDILRGLTGIDDIIDGREGHLLTEEHLDRIEGLEALLRPAGHVDYACRFMTLTAGACAIPGADTDGTPNIILAGAGSDLVEGRAGDDVLDGDLWLDVVIEWANPAGPAERFDSLQQLGDRVINGQINPADLHIRRIIRTPADPAGLDTTVYSTNATEYALTYHGDGYWDVFHDGAVELEEGDGRDVIRNFEYVQFPDRCIALDPISAPVGVPQRADDVAAFEDCPVMGSVVLNSASPSEDQPITATATLEGVTNPTDIIWEWQFGEASEEWEPSPNPSVDNGTTSTFTPRDAEPGNHLRAIISFLDDQGVRRSVSSPASINPVTNVNDVPTGPVIVPASPRVGDTLTATELADQDGIEAIVEDQLVTWRWQSGSGSAWSDLATTQQPFLAVPASALRSQIRVVAEYTDDHGTVEGAISAPTANVAPETPNSVPTGDVTLSMNQPAAGEDLAAITTTVADADGIPVNDLGEPQFAYQWQRFDGGVWTSIDGANAMVFPVGAELEGQRLRVQVTYTDLRGFTETLFSAASDPVTGIVVPPPAPAISGFTPTSGPAGTTEITISGANFSGTTEVTFNGMVTPAFTFVSDTELRAVVPVGATTGPVGVTTPGGSTTFGTFTVEDPPPPPPADGFTATAPVRVLDTREVPLAVPAGSVTEVQVAGVNGVPADASAVSFTLTVVDPEDSGWVVAFPCGEAMPLASNINFVPGQNIANLVLAKVGADGKVCLHNSAPADLLVDTGGFFPLSADYGPVTPTRLLDTREGLGEVPAGGVTEVQVTGVGGVPADASAVSLNVTAVNPADTGWLAVFPCGEAMPLASNLNFTQGQIIANAVVAKVGADGKVCVANSGPTNMVVDLTGWFPAGSELQSLTPARLLDTRIDPGAWAEPGTITVVQVAGRSGVPADATAAVLNVTVTDPQYDGHVTVYPCDAAAVPTASNVNYRAGQTIPSSAITKLAGDGTVCISTFAPTHLVVDVNGAF